MILLNALVTPSLGLIIWTTVVFLLLLFLLGKFAWKPVLRAIEEREKNIESAIRNAEEAKASLENLKKEGEKILSEARNEREVILKEAKELKEKLISDAKKQAQSEAEKIIQHARQQIQSEKQAALVELKNQVAVLSVEIAEKILKTELADKEKQKIIIQNLSKELNLN
jgi:F-type H+-transporting ATPase subunit b